MAENEDRIITYNYAEILDRCENFGDVFDLVKKTVKKALRRERAGLMLVLTDLPLNLGAFHGVGSNSIVMNRALLDTIVNSGRTKREINSFVYSILLHEYLHSLGYLDEGEVRQLVARVTRQVFGEFHPATELAMNGPWTLLPENLRPSDHARIVVRREGAEIISDFDRSDRKYIS